MQSPKKHRYIVAVTIIYTTKINGEDEGHVMPMNVMFMNKNSDITLNNIKQIHKASFERFMKEVSEPMNIETNVRDIVINNIVNLGYMTDEDFEGKNIEPVIEKENPFANQN